MGCCGPGRLANVAGPRAKFGQALGQANPGHKLGRQEVSADGMVGFINPLFISKISLNLFQTLKICIKFNSYPNFIKLVSLFF
jgi:hypothetical protein